MFLPANILGGLFALISAAIWGGGDFAGGFAARRGNQYQVLVISSISGLVVLSIAALVWRESFPTPRSILWAMLSGAAGAGGIVALYRALSRGQAAIVAPTAGVVGAGLSVVFGAFTQGMPGSIQLVGFGLALAGIWLVSSGPDSQSGASRREFLLACLAGVGFGGFFIFMGQVESGKILTPLIVSRCVMVCTGLLLVRLNRLSLPALTSNPPALLAGLLDAGGNLFFILAKQFTRLDIAVVLSSLYPASTVLLAGLILKEKTSLRQWAGVLICLVAIVLITK